MLEIFLPYMLICLANTAEPTEYNKDCFRFESSGQQVMYYTEEACKEETDELWKVFSSLPEFAGETPKYQGYSICEKSEVRYS